MKTGIKSLGYLGLNVQNVEGWNGLLQGVFAFERRDTDPDKAWLYKMDKHHHRLALFPSDVDNLAYIGWEVVGEACLDSIKKRLHDSSVEVEPLSSEDCRERAISGGIVFIDPIFGVRTELFFGAVIESAQFRPPRPMNGYVTGDQGMGHFVMMSSRQNEAVSFYRDILGFSVSDTMDFGGGPDGVGKLVFMHCNSRHHSLAIMTPPPGAPDGALNHIAFSVKDFDDIGYAYDIVREQNVPVLMTLGKHSNDLATSFYVANPSQSALEMSYGGLEIDDDWVVRHYDDTKIWGHTTYMPPRPLS